MLNIESTLRDLGARYWPLVKGWQTGLLLLTALAGYLGAAQASGQWPALFGLIGSLFLAISGGTVLNMGFDRDIDAQMARTCRRPLVTGQVSPGAAWRLGVVLSVLGLAWALVLSPLTAALVAAGLFFEIVVYTVWLKRRTAWSILLGGVAGAMPILTGWALATGGVDRIGLLLAVAVLFWVPTHNLTLSMRHLGDYRRAGVPTFPLVYGRRATHGLITFSGALAALAMSTAFVWIGLPAPIVWTSVMLGAGLICFALMAWIRPSEGETTVLFKYASLYMLSSMLLLAVGGLGMPV